MFLRGLPAIERLENRSPSPRGFVEMVSLGYAAETLTTLRCHSDLEELGLRHSPGSLAVVVSRCTTKSYGEQAQWAVSQCVTASARAPAPSPQRTRGACEI